MIFLNSVSSTAALVFYLPGVCTHTDAEGKQRKARVRNILKSLDKNTIFNEHPVYVVLYMLPRKFSFFVLLSFVFFHVFKYTVSCSFQ